MKPLQTRTEESVFIQAFLLLALLTLLTSGCSKMSPVLEAEVRQSFGLPADMPMKDLGVVKLRDGQPKRLSVRPGGYCTFTATGLTNGKVKLDIAFELGTKGTNAVRTETDQWVFCPPSVSDWRLCLTPKDENLAVAIQPVLIQ